jgi:hypothetical protein
MKKLKVVWCAAAVLLSVRATVAQTATTVPPTEPPQTIHVWEDPYGWWGGHFVYGPAMPAKFTRNEFSMDIFGSFTAAEEKFSHLFQENIRDGKWGGGVGINYFLTREIGIAGDINMPDNKGALVDSISGSLVLRLPSENTGLSPYIFGGGGRGTDRVWEWLGHGGFGLEWRWNPVTAIFSDVRYVWAEKTTDALLIRGGLRLIF